MDVVQDTWKMKRNNHEGKNVSGAICPPPLFQMTPPFACERMGLNGQGVIHPGKKTHLVHFLVNQWERQERLSWSIMSKKFEQPKTSFTSGQKHVQREKLRLSPFHSSMEEKAKAMVASPDPPPTHEWGKGKMEKTRK